MSVACGMDPADRAPVDPSALHLAVAAFTAAHYRACRRAKRAMQLPGWIAARCVALLDGSGWATNAADRAAIKAAALWNAPELRRAESKGETKCTD